MLSCCFENARFGPAKDRFDLNLQRVMAMTILAFGFIRVKTSSFRKGLRMHRGLEFAVVVIALVIAIGVTCIGIVFVFALFVDLTASWLVALLVLLLIAAVVTGIVIAANRSRTVGIHYPSILADLVRALVVLLSVTLTGAMASFFITIALIASSEHGVLPDRFLQLRETGDTHRVGVAVFVALQAGWIVPLIAQIYRGGLRRLPVAMRLSHTSTGYAIALSTVAMILIFLLGPYPHAMLKPS